MRKIMGLLVLVLAVSGQCVQAGNCPWIINEFLDGIPVTKSPSDLDTQIDASGSSSNDIDGHGGNTRRGSDEIDGYGGNTRRGSDEIDRSSSSSSSYGYDGGGSRGDSAP